METKKYSAVKAYFFAGDVVLTVAILSIFQIFLSKSFSEFAFRLNPNFYAACFIYSALFLLLLYVVSLPVKFADTFLVEHYFKLSNQSFLTWVKDEIKSLILSFILFLAAVEIFYFVVRIFPYKWWIILTGLWIFFSIVLIRIFPVILIPLFFKYFPVEPQGLKEKIFLLAKKAGVYLMDVCQIDLSRKTFKANAALAGLGKTRKIILSDTLMKNFDEEEIITVIAHEFGHFKYRHIWKLLAFSAGAASAGFFVLFLTIGKIAALAGSSGISDMSLLPILVTLLIVSGIILLPVQNFFSRILEREADKFSLDITSSPGKFISVMKKLADMNLSDIEPSPLKKIFLYDHPPVGERIRMAQKRI